MSVKEERKNNRRNQTKNDQKKLLFFSRHRMVENMLNSMLLYGGSKGSEDVLCEFVNKDVVAVGAHNQNNKQPLHSWRVDLDEANMSVPPAVKV